MQGGFPPPWLYDYVWCTLFLSSFQKMVLSSWFHLIIPPTYITNPHQSPHLKIPTSQETWCYCPLSGWECQLQPTQPKSWLTERTDVKRTGHDDCFVFLRWGCCTIGARSVCSLLLWLLPFFHLSDDLDEILKTWRPWKKGNSHTLKRSVVAKWARQSKWFNDTHYRPLCFVFFFAFPNLKPLSFQL